MQDRQSELPERLSALFQTRGGFKRAIGRIAAALGLSAVFATSVVGGVLLHLDSRPVRRVTRTLSSQLLATLFQGKIVVGEIDSVALHEVRIREAQVLDPDGKEVIDAHNIVAHVSTMRLLRSIWSSTGPIDLRITRVQIDDAKVTLIESRDSVAPTIADTFILKNHGVPTAGATPRAVSVLLPRIELGHVAVVGHVARSLDADVRHLVGSVGVVDDVVSVDVEPTGIVDRAYLPAVVDGTASYHLRIDTNTKRLVPHAIIDESGRARTDEPMIMWMSFIGSVGLVATSARCEIAGTHLTASASLPKITPEGVHAILPVVPVLTTASALVRVDGDLPDLGFQSTVEVAQGAGLGVVTITGRMEAQAAPKLELAFQTSELDPRDFMAVLPDARVNARGRIVGELTDEDPKLSLEAATLATTANGIVVPAVDVVIDLVHGELLGSTTVHEPGIPIDGRFVIAPSGQISFGVVAQSDGIEKAPRLDNFARGAGRAEVKGTLDDGRLQATVHATGSGISVASIAAGRAVVDGTLAGPLDDLHLTSQTSLDSVVAEDQSFDKVVVHADGPLLNPFVKLHMSDRDVGKVDAEGALSVKGRAVSAVKFKIERDGVTAVGNAARIGLRQDGAIAAEGVNVSGDGLGAIAGSVAIHGGELLGKLRADGIDLDKLGRLVGLPIPLGGVANVDVDVERTAKGRTGHVEVELEGGEALAVSGISARVSAKFDGPTVESSGYVRLASTASDAERESASKQGILAMSELCDGTIAEVRFANAKGQLTGPLLEKATWKHFVGEADLAAENWNLHCLTKRIPFGLPIGDAAGLVTTRVHLVRRDGDPYPSLEDAYVRTHGLELVGKKALLSSVEPWESRLIDGELKGGLDGRSGHVDAHLMLFDGSILGEITASLSLDLDKLLRDAPKGAPTDVSQSYIATLPFDISASIPRRAISELHTLPAPLRDRVPSLDGDIRIDAQAHGTLAEPYVYVSAQGFRVAPRAAMGAAESWAPPVDATLTGTYESDDGKAAIEAHILHDGANVATINAGVEVAAKDLLKGGDKPIPWTGGMFVALTELPLGSIPALADRDVAGPLSGTLALSGLNATPTLDAKLSMPFVRLGELYFDGTVVAHITPRAGASEQDTAEQEAGSQAPTKVVDATPRAPVPPDGTGAPPKLGGAETANSATTDKSEGVGSLEVDLDGEDGGILQVLAYAGIHWDGLTIPTLDKDSAGGLAMSAKALRLGAAFPLVADNLSKLDGVLDGAAQLKWGRVGAGDEGRISGDLKVHDAVVFIPQFGQELRKGKLSIIANPLGVVRVEGIEAGGIRGRVHGNLLGRFDGLVFRSATGEIQIDEGQEIPITFEGVPVGATSMKMKLDANYDKGQLSVHADIPSARLALPGSSSRNVSGLDEEPTISLSDPLGPPKEPRSKTALRYLLSVDLERLTITGTDLEATVKTNQGKPVTVELAEDVKVGGDIVFDRGYIVLRQKRFELDTGLVRLRQEEAGNPYVNATAHWDSPDGGRVYVDYVGNLEPITDEKIRFRSDPPRTKQDIIATLLFGSDLSSTPTGGTGQGTNGVTGLAADVGGSVASQALNSLLSSRYVTLSVDTGTDGGLRGKVEWRATEGLTFGFSGEQIQAQTTTAVATSPWATTQQTAGPGATSNGAQGEVSLDWRFARNWSLRSTVGAGVLEPSTGVDILWQYRY